MPKLKRMKLKEGQRVTYKGARATVLHVGTRKIQIRDNYGYTDEVPRSELSPWKGD